VDQEPLGAASVRASATWPSPSSTWFRTR